MLNWVRERFNRSNTTTTEKTTTTPTTSGATKAYRYEVALPGETPVVLRAANERAVRKNVRDAHNLKRLPAGTTVNRLD